MRFVAQHYSTDKFFLQIAELFVLKENNKKNVFRWSNNNGIKREKIQYAVCCKTLHPT